MSRSEQDLACWIDAAFGEAAWTTALDASAEILGAGDVALGLAARPGIPAQVFCSSHTSPGFEARCKELLAAYGAEAVQSRLTSEGRLMWAHAASSARQQVQDVAVFAQWAGEGDPQMLYRIASVAARAVFARREIAEMRAALALCGTSLDRLPFGVAVIDEGLYVKEPNAACRAIFQRADGLSLHQGRLTCRVEADSAAIAEAVHRTITGRDGAPVRVARARGAEPYTVKPVMGQDAEADHCVLVIIDPETRAIFTRETLSALKDLNAGELAAALT
ncbi:MAG: hypothetical protein QM759_01725 [Terricaulis sp.]